MVAAFCLFEAGSVFQTFSPDKPDIFMPWTNMVDRRKIWGTVHGNGEGWAMESLHMQRGPPRHGRWGLLST